jgi:hypothetical protein
MNIGGCAANDDQLFSLQILGFLDRGFILLTTPIAVLK